MLQRVFSAPADKLYRTVDKLTTYCLSVDERRPGSRVISVQDSGAEGPGFKSQSRRCRVTVLGKLLTPIVHLFTKRRNWQQPS